MNYELSLDKIFFLFNIKTDYIYLFIVNLLQNIRLNSATGWCGKTEPFTYVTVDLGHIFIIKALVIKGVITNDVVGRPTEIRFFYKVQEAENFVVYFPVRKYFP